MFAVAPVSTVDVVADVVVVDVFVAAVTVDGCGLAVAVVVATVAVSAGVAAAVGVFCCAPCFRYCVLLPGLFLLLISLVLMFFCVFLWLMS